MLLDHQPACTLYRILVKMVPRILPLSEKLWGGAEDISNEQFFENTFNQEMFLNQMLKTQIPLPPIFTF